jgi:hypothetical protein
MKKSNTKVAALLISLIDNTIHEITSLIANMGAVNTIPAMIIAI